MNYKTLSFLLLSAAAAMAAPELQKKQDLSEHSSLMDSLNSLATQTDLGSFSLPTDYPSDYPSIPADFTFKMPPSSIMSVLETAIPPSALSELSDPMSVLSDMEAGSTPGWYQSLPADVKSYFATAYATGAMDTGDSTTTDSGASATSTSGSDSSDSSSQTTGSEGATSTGGAPAATGFMAMSIAGAAGVLGLAIAL